MTLVRRAAGAGVNTLCLAATRASRKLFEAPMIALGKRIGSHVLGVRGPLDEAA